MSPHCLSTYAPYISFKCITPQYIKCHHCVLESFVLCVCCHVLITTMSHVYHIIFLPLYCKHLCPQIASSVCSTLFPHIGSPCASHPFLRLCHWYSPHLCLTLSPVCSTLSSNIMSWITPCIPSITLLFLLYVHMVSPVCPYSPTCFSPLSEQYFHIVSLVSPHCPVAFSTLSYL